MATTLETQLEALAGREAWQDGLRLFQEGAVLDVQRAARGIEARVANRQGRFERVRLSVRREGVKARCSCDHPTDSPCAHAVAGLLQLAKVSPDFAACLAEAGADPVAESVAAGQPPAVRDTTAAAEAPRLPPLPSRAQSIRSLLGQPLPKGRLEVRFPDGMPTLDSRWNRVTLQLDLFHGNRPYSASNIRRLVETGSGAGHMHLGDFTPQAQQIMRYAVTHGEPAGAQFALSTYDVADLFHCLTGYDAAYGDQTRLTIHSERVSLVLVVQTLEGASEVAPRLCLPGHGILPLGDLHPVLGRGGCWIGIAGEYWWLPAVVDSAWLRGFAKGESMAVTAEEAASLAEWCERGLFPAEFVPAASAVEIASGPGRCEPVLNLDWNRHGLTARLEFAYGNRRVGAHGPSIVWLGAGFVTRDTPAEAAAEADLLTYGFARAEPRDSTFRLESPERVWEFVHDLLPHLNQRWQVYVSTGFTTRQKASQPAALNVTAGREAGGWFDLECQMNAADGSEIAWPAVQAAVASGSPFIHLESGAVARLSEELLRVLRLLTSRALERAGNTLRFGSYCALQVGGRVGPYWRGGQPAWHRLCQRLTQPPAAVGLPPPLDQTLRDYQKEGVAWLLCLAECGFHGVLADEMGLGKTLQALAVVAHRRLVEGVRLPSLVVCPTSLVQNWLMEAGRFVPQLRAVAIQGSRRDERIEALGSTDLAITSYALMRRDIRAYQACQFDYVILDEAQHIKNPQTANSRTCKLLQARNRLILTGTPLENSVREVWSLFDFLLPGLLGSQEEFRETVERPLANGDGDRATAELAAWIRPFVLRRTKADVCRQLPPKLEQVVYFDLSPGQRQVYTQFLVAGRELLRRGRQDGWQQGRFQLLAVLMRLRQVCSDLRLLPPELRPPHAEQIPSAKMELLQEVVLEAIDGGHRVLLFSQFTSFLALVRAWLEQTGVRYEYLDGSTRDRQERVDRFNADASIPVFLLSLRAGGLGLNLTGADTVVHSDQWWNPMVEAQATDRTHRIGQSRPVTSLKLVARHTVEERILQLQEAKRELFTQVMAGVPARLGDLAPEDLEFLLDSPEVPSPEPPDPSLAVEPDSVSLDALTAEPGGDLDDETAAG